MNVIIIVGFIFTLILLFFTIFLQKRQIKNLKFEQEKFIEKIDQRFIDIEERKQREIKENKEYVVRKNKIQKTSKAQRVFDSIIRELREEGISSIELENLSFNFDGSPWKTINKENDKFIFFSYDELEEMRKLLLTNPVEFHKKYKIKYRDKELIGYIKAHYYDKETVKEILKNKIKTDLGNELTDILTKDEKPKEEIIKIRPLQRSGLLRSYASPNIVNRSVKEQQLDELLKRIKERI